MTRGAPESQDPREFDELETQMLSDGDDVLADWLGLCGRGDSAGVCWHRPLPALRAPLKDGSKLEREAVDHDPGREADNAEGDNA